MQADLDQSSSDLVELASKIQNLTDEFGIDPAVATLLLRLQKDQSQLAADTSFDRASLLLNSEEQALDLATLISGLAAESDPNSESEVSQSDDVAQEFMLLTDYFKSVRGQE